MLYQLQDRTILETEFLYEVTSTHLIGCLLVQEDPAERREKGPGWAALEAPVHVVRHEEQHAELLQRDELHVTLIPGPHLEPLQEGLGVDLRHGRWSVERYYMLGENM